MDLGQVFTCKNIANYMVSLFSIDKNEKVLEPCFGNGAFLQACIDNGHYNLDGCEIDNILFDSTKERFDTCNLMHIDFLKYAPRYRYSGIIMNPPYVRQEKIDDLAELGITKCLLRQNSLYEGLPSTANLYMYFIVKAIDLLKKNGELVVIFPGSWMNARSGNEFKNCINSNASIIEEIHINGDVFQTNALVDVVILKIVKSKCKTSNPVRYLIYQDDVIKTEDAHKDDIEILMDIPYHQYASIRRGLTTGWNEKFVNPPLVESKFFKPIISSPKSIDGYNTDTAITDKLLSIPSGSDLDEETRIYLNQLKIELSESQKPKTLYEKSKASEEWFLLSDVDSNGILFSYFVRNDMKFVMNTSSALVRDNFYIIYPQIDKYLMFALLNNYYTYYQLEKLGKKYGAGLLKLQRYDIENLKFINLDYISENNKKKLIKYAKELIKCSNRDYIQKITEVLSNYTNVGCDEIMSAYLSVKNKRLEAS